MKNMNVVRNIRLQLKTGFMQKEPDAYRFMKRYPPLSRDTAPPIRKIQKMDVPYLHLYNKALERNPSFSLERVYPAYWKQEPQALTLAKIQYELMGKGVSEEEAWTQAMDKIRNLESKAYEEVQHMLQTVNSKGSSAGSGVGEARLPFVTDAALGAEIAAWREKLKVTPYEDMDLADQGEIDYIIQTKVLKWKEVERERRMSDPVFAMQFEKLKAAIMPEIHFKTKAKQDEIRKSFKKNIMSMYDVSESHLCTKSPFFVEDYVNYFKQLKANPALAKWGAQERESFARWIIDTLALREVMDRESTDHIRRYLELLRNTYFPMVRYPEAAASMEVPTVDKIKALLYENDIGYKRQDGKLFVKRFYRIPMLLFPKETFATEILYDEERLETVMSEEKGLYRAIAEAGLDEASFPELKKQLEEHMSKNEEVAYGKQTEMDMSSLDALLHDGDDDEEDAVTGKVSPTLASSGSGSSASEGGESAGSQDGAVEAGANDDDDDDLDDDLWLGEEDEQLDGDATDPETRFSGKSAEWHRLYDKYCRSNNVLDKEREKVYGQIDDYGLDDLNDEEDFQNHLITRMENETILRNSQIKIYEAKESARRAREWKRRGVWQEKLPRPTIPLIDLEN